MALICEDLAGYGVVLIPPSADEYFERRSEIEQRLWSAHGGPTRVEEEVLDRLSERGSDWAAILVNRAQTAIVNVTYAWSFLDGVGRERPHTFAPGAGTSLLLPFGFDERGRKIHAYWHTIFPGSKRLITADGDWLGDNSDVREPAADEIARGGSGGGKPGHRDGSLRPVKLALDGVFFADGSFAGPNQRKTFEHTVCAAEGYFACAALAREALEMGTTSDDFFRQVRELTGYEEDVRPSAPFHHYSAESPSLDEIRQDEWHFIGWQAHAMRMGPGGEKAAISSVAAWAEAQAPQLHRV